MVDGLLGKILHFFEDCYSCRILNIQKKNNSELVFNVAEILQNKFKK